MRRILPAIFVATVTCVTMRTVSAAVPDMEDRAAVHADVRRMQAWCAPRNGRVARAYECVNYCEDALRELGGPTGNWQGAMLAQINKNAWAKCRRFYMQVAGAAEIEQRANAEVAQSTRGAISAAEIAADELARRGLAGAQPLAAQESYNLYWVKDIRGRNVTLAAVHRARDEEPLVALVPLAGGKLNEFRYDPSVLAEFKRVILPLVKARAPMVQKVDLANYVRAFHRLSEPGGQELPLMNLSFAPDILSGGVLGSGEWNHHPNRGGPADPQVVIGNGYDQNTIVAARVADQQMAVTEAIRDAQVAKELAQRGPRPPNHPLADFIDRMGMGTVARDVFALVDRDRRANIDASGVTYVEDVRTVVKVCNDGDRPARVASVRADCPASMLFDHSLKCVLNMSGWSHLEPKQCKPLVTSPHLEAALAVYFENDGKWEPGLYGREVTWKTTSNVPAGKMASMFEPACGKLNGNFWNRGGDVRIGVGGFPCAKGEGLVWLNIYVRGDSEQPYRFRF